jgi:hypothetical protein
MTGHDGENERTPAAAYTSLFCEENIWWLARRQLHDGVPGDELTVIFITNPAEQTLMMQQRAAPPGQPTCWDYHVVLRRQDATSDLVFDLDTRLDLPTPTADYVAATFPTQARVPPAMRAWVRLVPAAAYVARFHSDRRHMRGRISAADLPDWPPITGDDDRIDLADYRDLTRDLGDGSRVLTLGDWLREIDGGI